MIAIRTGFTPRPLSFLAGALVALLAIPGAGYSKSKQTTDNQPPALSAEVNGIINRIVTGEKRYVENLRRYSPRVETYLQFDKRNVELGDTVSNDAYFIGRLHFGNGPEEISFVPEDLLRKMRNGLKNIAAPVVPPHVFLNRFATSTMLDAQNFDQAHYEFDPVGWEYLGDVRCLAIDVRPGKKAVGGAFEGRIWVEEHNYAIVRLNGTRVNPGRFRFYYHFDSWRENLRPGEWLPVYIYSEESGAEIKVRYKANTRLWGYDLSVPHQQEEWTKILVDSPVPVRESSDANLDTSPVEGKRQLELVAERNVLQRLEKARLIAPPGPVDKIMETVLNNLVVTNHLDNLPPVHCRVMMTSPLESFTLRYTIVLSRGLIDVLPDEPSLAMVLAHELGHVVLGHKLDTRYAFNDRLLLRDEQILPRMDLGCDRKEEAAADAKALELLNNSPYKDKLGNAGLFLRAAAEAEPRAHQLFGAHLGNRLASSHGATHMASLMSGAPTLNPTKLDQIAALPLGSRVQVNAWDGTITFPNRKAVALVDPSEKLPFRVSAQFPHLTNFEETSPTKVAARQGQ